MTGGKRIVLATLGSLGDLHPLLGLALELRARGHDVVMATSDFYRPRIENAGFEFAPLRPLASPEDAHLVRQVMDPKTGPEFLFRTLLLPHLRSMYEDLLAASHRADFLVAGEIVFAARLVAETTGLPWAGAILAPVSFFSAHDPAVIPLLPFATHLVRAPAAVQRLMLRLAQFATRRWSDPIVALRRELGLPAHVQPLFRDRFSPLLNLALFADALGRPQPDWPPNTVQTGFVYYDTPDKPGADAGVLAFLEGGPPPVVFTLGSTAVLLADDFFEESLRTARLLGIRALLVMGDQPRPEGLGENILACGYAPYSRIFPRAACVVHQGGAGTIAQALRAGSPQLVVPYAFDQPDNAARMVRLGVGLAVPRNRYRARRIGPLLLQLTGTDQHRRFARRIGARLQTENGAARACDALERCLLSLRD